jgi:threonine dehydratase
MSREPTFDDIRRAAERLRPWVHQTPVLTSRTLDGWSGARLFFKCENLQRAGAFKIRGAGNAVLSLSDEEAARGVVTHSSGNHGAALALAARNRGIPAHVVMPRGSPRVKREAVAGYGAVVTECEPTVESREATARLVQEETGATPVHPYDDPRVIAGQGTAALELLEEVPDLDLIVAPVGGGGLAAGTALAASGLAPGCRVVAAEPAGADDTYRCFQAGERTPPAHPPETIADGLRTWVGALTFPLIQRLVCDVVTVSEEGIVTAMRHVWERMKLVIEPSAAVPLAAVLEGRLEVQGRRVGVIFSGGNVDLDRLPWGG